jgi:hypothetical protein
MNPLPHQSEDEKREPQYRDVEWPQSGRFVFGPWCLLGAWPAVFGVVEEVEEKNHERRSNRR